MIPVQHRLKIPTSPIRMALKQFGCELRVSMPAEVVSFDPAAQTLVVQPTIQERMLVNAVPTETTLPQIEDVPIQIPGGGGWSSTFPIAAGDEVLLIFSDMAFDQWWQSGGVQKQPDGKLFRHDLFDCFAIVGLRNQTRVLGNYSTTSAQLRSDDGTVVIDLDLSAVTVTAPAVNIVSPAISAKASGGTAQALVNAAWLNWFTADFYPWAVAHGYTGPAPPSASTTTVLEAE